MLPDYQLHVKYWDRCWVYNSKLTNLQAQGADGQDGEEGGVAGGMAGVQGSCMLKEQR